MPHDHLKTVPPHCSRDFAHPPPRARCSLALAGAAGLAFLSLVAYRSEAADSGSTGVAGDSPTDRWGLNWQTDDQVIGQVPMRRAHPGELRSTRPGESGDRLAASSAASRVDHRADRP